MRAAVVSATVFGVLMAAGLLVAGFGVFDRVRGGSEEAVPWGLQGVSADAKTLTIRCVRGDPYCFSVGRIETDESPSRVAITVVREACRGSHTDVYREEESDVELDERLGSRMLIDGCTAEGPPPARALSDRFGELVRARLDPNDPFAKPNGEVCPAPSRNESGG
jgi:hypothetical protein